MQVLTSFTRSAEAPVAFDFEPNILVFRVSAFFIKVSVDFCKVIGNAVESRSGDGFGIGPGALLFAGAVADRGLQ
jgi:hypothetical protein